MWRRSMRQDGHELGAVQSSAEAQERKEQGAIDFPLDKWLERAEAWLPLVKRRSRTS